MSDSPGLIVNFFKQKCKLCAEVLLEMKVLGASDDDFSLQSVTACLKDMLKTGYCCTLGTHLHTLAERHCESKVHVSNTKEHNTVT